MIINKTDLLDACPLSPMEREKKTFIAGNGMRTSYGLTECGYDIRLAQDIWLFPGRRFVLASSFERFHLPNWLMGRVLNKSTIARLGVDASRTTNIEPGWVGYLTIELEYARWKPLFLQRGTGILQVIFEEIKTPTNYVGKYQNQPQGPVKAII